MIRFNAIWIREPNAGSPTMRAIDFAHGMPDHAPRNQSNTWERHASRLRELQRGFANEGMQFRRRVHVSWQGEPWIPQAAVLHCKPQPVVIAAPLANLREVSFREAVMPDKIVLGRRQCNQAGTHGVRQQTVTGRL